jgi:hypothetical protein
LLTHCPAEVQGWPLCLRQVVPLLSTHTEPEVQVSSVVHEPLLSHDCRRSGDATQRSEPGAQFPTHVPETQAVLPQPTAEPQDPPLEHVCTPLFEHCLAPGAHAPVQLPATQAWLLQALAEPQNPVAKHVCTPLPEHCLAPGAHSPTHAPESQALLEHATAKPHEPVLVHVCTPLPEHCYVPGSHSPPQLADTQA